MITASPAMKISISQEITAADFIIETTFARNQSEAASYTEIVIHIILTCPKGQSPSLWQLANGKFMTEDMLNRMVKDGLMSRRAAKRSMYSSPTYTRTF